jgi:hypothetical protein
MSPQFWGASIGCWLAVPLQPPNRLGWLKPCQRIASLSLAISPWGNHPQDK